MRLIVYGSADCIGCNQLKDYLSTKGFKYTYKDILSELEILREFLLIRDNNEVYKEVKEKNMIGIPTIIIDDALYIYRGEEWMDAILSKYESVK